MVTTRSSSVSRNTGIRSGRRISSVSVSQPSQGTAQPAAGPNYTDRLNELLNQVTQTSTQLQTQQVSLQQQALEVQRQQAADSSRVEANQLADESSAQRQSYVSLLQQILLNS